MDANLKTLDLARFAKIIALARARTHDGTDNANERASAMNKANAMAERAGLTLDEALRQLDDQPKPTSRADEFDRARKREAAAAEERRRSPEFAEHPLEEAIRTTLIREGNDLDSMPSGRIPLEQSWVIREAAIPFPGNLQGVIAELGV